MHGQQMSDFGLCATDVREPRQVRKEATVTSLSVCRRSPEVWSDSKDVLCPLSVVRCAVINAVVDVLARLRTLLDD